VSEPKGVAGDLDRERKIELIMRSLGIRHKLKVHESMKPPETHEDMAIMMLSKWELEDELRAIEQILLDLRDGNVSRKRHSIEKDGVQLKVKRRPK
jgi:hypothetical protein